MKTANFVVLLLLAGFIVQDVWYVANAWSAFNPQNVAQHTVLWGGCVMATSHGAWCMLRSTGFIAQLKLLTSLAVQLLFVGIAALITVVPFKAYSYEGAGASAWLVIVLLFVPVAGLMFWSSQVAVAQLGIQADAASPRRLT